MGYYKLPNKDSTRYFELIKDLVEINDISEIAAKWKTAATTVYYWLHREDITKDCEQFRADTKKMSLNVFYRNLKDLRIKRIEMLQDNGVDPKVKRDLLNDIDKLIGDFPDNPQTVINNMPVATSIDQFSPNQIEKFKKIYDETPDVGTDDGDGTPPVSDKRNNRVRGKAVPPKMVKSPARKKKKSNTRAKITRKK